jgi:hypothetical protein
MKKLYPLLLTLLLVSLLPACKGNAGKDPAPEPPKKEAILRAWKIKRVLVNGAVDNATNYSAVRFEFKPGGTFTYTGATGTTTGTWELAANDQVLILNKGTATQEEPAVLLLTTDNLHLEYTVKNYKNGNVVYVYEYIPA